MQMRRDMASGDLMQYECPRPRMRRPRAVQLKNRQLLAASAAGGLAATAVAAAGVYGARQLNGPRRRDLTYTFTPFELGVDFESARFTAEDGTPLAGWWLEAPGARNTVVVSHGFRGNKTQMLGISAGLWRGGMNVLLFDFRGNGDSGDGPLSLAHYEQRDLRAAVAYARERAPKTEIDLVGFSMGAALSLLIAAEDPRISRIIADSPFAELSDVVATAAVAMHLPRATIHLIDAVSQRWHGYGFGQVRPLDVIDRIAPRPLLVIHGDQDRVIPVEHARRLAAAAGPTAQLVITEGVDHCGAYFADRSGYIARAVEFFRR